MSMPGGIVEVGADEVEDRAATRDEGLVVGEDPLDVVGPAHGEEVVALVVVERRFLAEPSVDGIRVGVDVDVVRVVVHAVGLGAGHVAIGAFTPSRPAERPAEDRPRSSGSTSRNW